MKRNKFEVEEDPNTPPLDAFFFCISLFQGCQIISVIHLATTMVTFVGLTFWIIISYLETDCFGPIYVDFIENNCQDAINIQMSDDELEFKTFTDELLILSAHFQDYKMGFIFTLSFVILVSLLSFIAGITLLIGTRIKSHLIMIPWLIFARVAFILLFVSTAVIIFLEARLFGVGQSVFGLFSVPTLALAFTLAYFWLVAKSLSMIYKTELENSNLHQLIVGNVNLSFISDQKFDAPWANESAINGDEFHLKEFSKSASKNAVLDVSKL